MQFLRGSSRGLKFLIEKLLRNGYCAESPKDAQTGKEETNQPKSTSGEGEKSGFVHAAIPGAKLVQAAWQWTDDLCEHPGESSVQISDI